jgi:large subunit ribosomal protein L9
MEVVLLENIKNLGQIGDIVKVRRGHGRNFLIKYGKALKASKENIDIVNKKKDTLNQKNLELKKNAKKIFDIITNSNYKFSKRTKENGELYGSIKPVELSKAISSAKKIEIRPSQIDVGKEIKKIGTYEIRINLHAEIQGKIHIEVVKEEEKLKS